MSAEDFHLIDILSQCEEVEARLRGKSLEEKERWFASQGELLRLPDWIDSCPRYNFKSWAGVERPFGIRGDEILVFGEHFVFPRRTPNKSPQSTTPSVTPPAGQEARQP